MDSDDKSCAGCGRRDMLSSDSDEAYCAPCWEKVLKSRAKAWDDWRKAAARARDKYDADKKRWEKLTDEEKELENQAAKMGEIYIVAILVALIAGIALWIRFR